jgi:DNA-directed RNA polymerase subunit RPC12/RpoP
LIAIDPTAGSRRAELKDSSAQTKVRWGVAGIVLLAPAVGAWIHVWHNPMRAWLICPSLVFVIASLFAFSAVFFRDAKCVRCGAAVGVGADAAYVQCRQCQTYFIVEHRAVSLVPDEFVAETPVFKLKLPQRFRLPQMCCVCGGTPTRSLRVTSHSSQDGVNAAVNVLSVVSVLGGGGGLFLAGGGKTVSIDLPICDLHEEGAELAADGIVSLKSYRFYTQLRDLNASPQRVKT